MELRELIEALKPTTLAAVAVDIEDMGKGASFELAQFGRRCERELENLVGKDEAQMMIEQDAGSLVDGNA